MNYVVGKGTRELYRTTQPEEAAVGVQDILASFGVCVPLASIRQEIVTHSASEWTASHVRVWAKESA